jgi:hypothetical protein
MHTIILPLPVTQAILFLFVGLQLFHPQNHVVHVGGKKNKIPISYFGHIYVTCARRIGCVSKMKISFGRLQKCGLTHLKRNSVTKKLKTKI